MSSIPKKIKIKDIYFQNGDLYILDENDSLIRYTNIELGPIKYKDLEENFSVDFNFNNLNKEE